MMTDNTRVGKDLEKARLQRRIKKTLGYRLDEDSCASD
jgi:hypothetical protein